MFTKSLSALFTAAALTVSGAAFAAEPAPAPAAGSEAKPAAKSVTVKKVKKASKTSTVKAADSKPTEVKAESKTETKTETKTEGGAQQVDMNKPAAQPRTGPSTMVKKSHVRVNKKVQRGAVTPQATPAPVAK